MSILRDLREQKKLTTKEAARALGFTASYLSKVERGDTPLSTDLIKAAAKFYGVDPVTIAPDYESKEVTQLRRLREERNMTLTEVSDAVGLSPGHLSQIERGGRGMSSRVARELSKLYGVELEGFRLPKDSMGIDADKLRQLREAKGISATRAAGLIGIDTAALLRLESGENRTPHYATFVKIAEFYGVAQEELLPELPAGTPDLNDFVMKNTKFLVDGEVIDISSSEARERMLSMIRAGAAWIKELDRK